MLRVLPDKASVPYSAMLLSELSSGLAYPPKVHSPRAYSVQGLRLPSLMFASVLGGLRVRTHQLKVLTLAGPSIIQSPKSQAMNTKPPNLKETAHDPKQQSMKPHNPNPKSNWVVVKIIVPFWVPILIRGLI